MHGYKVIGSGSPAAWHSVLPEIFRGYCARPEHPSLGLAYVFNDKKAELIAPARWEYFRFDGMDDDVEVLLKGRLMSVGGERGYPSRAILRPEENAPAIIRFKRLLYLNGSPFHAFQAWLQGQESMNPWQHWRHGIFWLDEMAAFLKKLLARFEMLDSATRQLFPSTGRNCVVFRHDLDYSRDTSYLEAEEKIGLPGVYAVLRDGNTRFWVDELRKYPTHESAFHYNTGRYSRFGNWVRRRLGLRQSQMKVSRKDVAGRGLYGQVRWAREKGIGIRTLHRHLSFVCYPEFVDAIDFVLDQETDVLGSSSMFSGEFLRWGAEKMDGANATYEPGNGYWFPFRLAHAGENGRILRGWESSSLMEPEPELVEQMLDYDIPSLPQKVITLNFHPAHANKPNFYRDGSLKAFKRVLEIIRSRRDVKVETLASIYNKLNSKVAETEA